MCTAAAGFVTLMFRDNSFKTILPVLFLAIIVFSAVSTCSIHGQECHQGLFSRNLYVGQRIPLAGVAHQNGTIRFGHDPKTSALDVNCKTHDVDNLYVVDGSFFPSSAAVNPALTIIANAMRVGDHLLQRLGVTATEYKANASREAEVVIG